ncbi:hypothetical protein MLD38_027447 [Melastoma candidum]|uniref:Uncharacterized protein n=1 Tax=Melastoma candidum TaxID=119954 RepID=A0ACB9P3L2_9MYRT|nr:hypothetical protein MLD38_027447 [Melastoma candidum]
MLSWADVSRALTGTVPLYIALMLGYGSVRWWRTFTAEHCDGINRMVCFFIIPLFSFQFTAAHADPFETNYSVIAADAISKILAVFLIAVWAKFCRVTDRAGWCITGFSLCTLTNLLLVGVPVAKSMYGQLGIDLLIQLSVVQATLWFPILLCFLELRKSFQDKESSRNGSLPSSDVEKDSFVDPTTRSQWSLFKIVGWKLAVNPNIYACVFGVIWAIISRRRKLKMPEIVDDSIQILSKAGIGTAMFNIGIFMAMQRKVIACGTKVAIFALVLRFVVGPALTTLGALAVGLHGGVLQITIIQAALPQAITTFIFAKEYGLHADVFSTAVVFGTLVSLPVLVAYCAALQVIQG